MLLAPLSGWPATQAILTRRVALANQNYPCEDFALSWIPLPIPDHSHEGDLILAQLAVVLLEHWMVLKAQIWDFSIRTIFPIN